MFSLKIHNRVKEIPPIVQEYMERKFNLVAEFLHTLRCFEYEGTVNERSVQRFQIFSPEKAEHLSIKNRFDLGQHPELILFEGYIEGHNRVYVADRRTPLVQRHLHQEIKT